MYCTTGEVLSVLKDDMIDVILGPDLIEDEEERTEKITPLAEDAVADACAEIDGYIGKRYRVPLAKCPQIIRKLAKDIAVYNLASRTGIDEDDRENTIYIRYKNAISFLLLVAKGTADIGTEEDGSTPDGGMAANGFRMRSSDRTFSRESMKGW